MSIENELIEISGGIDSQTNKLVNTYGIEIVNNYFYSNNLRRPFAYQHVDSLINNYVEQVDRLGVKSSLKGANIQVDSESLFKNLTIAESILILELLKNRISFDERRIINGC